MKWKQYIRRTAAVVLCLLLVLCNMPSAASAAASEPYPFPVIDDLNRLCSLSVNIGAPGVPVRVYRVADVSADVRFTLTGDFTRYNVSLDNMTSTKWRDLAQTLRGYVFLDSLTPCRAGMTNGEGIAVFSDLPVGLYLVDADAYKDPEGSGKTIQPAAFTVCLPNWEAETDEATGAITGGHWQYNVSARPKYRDLDGEITMRRVLKVWDDAGNEANRPARITVSLLKNGEIYDTVELTAENNWRHAWEELDGSADWTLVETGGSGYTVSVSLQGLTFVLTNSYSPPDNPPPPDKPPPPGHPPPPGPRRPPAGPPAPPDTPDNPDNPLTDIPDDPPPEVRYPDLPPLPDVDIPDPDVPLATTEPDPDTPDPDTVNIDDPDVPLATLPQTGQLWWPVPLLAASGMMLLLLGLIWNRRGRSDEG